MRLRLVASVSLLVCLVAAGSAVAFPKANPADRLAAVPIEDYRYDRATRCLKRTPPGTLALQEWLEQNVRGESWGIMRCEKWGKRSASLHAEGRAIDWHLDAHDPTDRRAARKLIDLLLAGDRMGNPHALARRMGVQEIIWDCRSWWSGSEAMGRYSACVGPNGKPARIDDTTAHRDHVHIGLNRAGARMRTSFWQ
jgi:hypothetical protein